MKKGLRQVPEDATAHFVPRPIGILTADLMKKGLRPEQANLFAVDVTFQPQT